MSSRTAPSSIFSNYNFYTNISILAAVSLDVESYSAFINFFHKCNFYTNISILAAVSHDVERAAPSSIFSDEIDCVKFITISKATKEKKSRKGTSHAGQEHLRGTTGEQKTYNRGT